MQAAASNGLHHPRGSSQKNLQTMQEERKTIRANMGQQVVADNPNRNTARVAAQLQTRNPLNEFANEP